jgi:serine protease Do
MSDLSQSRIIIRHVSGSKINQVEQIPLKDLHEVTIGRDAASTVAYDQKRDDVVSRRHAAIRVEGGDSPVFKLRDLGSSNGTFLNNEPISGEVELAPDDLVELGKGGPKFNFDVQPRPANMALRTRVIDALDSTVTRAIAGVSTDHGGTREAVTFGGTKEVAPPKVSVGKETVLRMLSQERKSTSRTWVGSIAAVLALFCIGGFALYRHSEAVATSVGQQVAQVDAGINNNLNAKLGMGAKDINDKYENTTVRIELQWRLYDRETSKPVFQKVLVTDDGTQYPLFVKLDNSFGSDAGKVVRWLTLDDQNRTNLPIGLSGSGSGFVVGSQGFILTNKHVAAGWAVRYEDIGEGLNANDIGLVVPYALQFKNKKDKEDAAVSLKSDDMQDLKDWIPATGAYVFDPDRALLIDGATDNNRVFIGRNEVLEVRFPGNRMSMEANLVRASTDADAALIKIDAAEDLKTAELARIGKVVVGDRVMVLGYPGVSEMARMTFDTLEGGVIHHQSEIIPEPTLTEGIVSHLGTPIHNEGQATVYSDLDDAFQISINSTGAGNSGGPVFNDQGQVIGLYTYTSEEGGARVSFAVPISHGIDLMQPQRAGAD